MLVRSTYFNVATSNELPPKSMVDGRWSMVDFVEVSVSAGARPSAAAVEPQKIRNPFRSKFVTTTFGSKRYKNLLDLSFSFGGKKDDVWPSLKTPTRGRYLRSYTWKIEPVSTDHI